VAGLLLFFIPLGGLSIFLGSLSPLSPLMAQLSL